MTGRILRIVLTVGMLLALCACAGIPDGVPYGTVAWLADETPASPDAPLTEPAEETAAVPDIRRVSLTAAGDAIVHPGIWMEAQKTARLAGGGRSYDFSHLFTECAEFISGYDIAFVNQETLMAGEEYGYSGYPRFNTPRDLAADLITAGFDVVNIANNHMMDQMAEGLASTIAYWKTQPVTLIGGYESTSDYDTPRIVEKNGIRIAFLSYCYGTNGLSVPAGSALIIPYLDEDAIRRQTAAARECADFVVVSVHWGEDSVQAVTEEQKTYAQLFADCGADVVLGHHPHLIQPVEWITGKDGNRMLCAYSLGNLFSLMARAENMVGGFLSLELVMEDGACRIENTVFHPTVFYYNTGFFGQKILFQQDYTEALAVSHGVQTYAETYNKTAAELLSYTRGIIGAEFLAPEVRS